MLLDKLLEVDDGDRHSTLDKLRRPPTRVSGPAMIGALERAAEILGLGFAEGTSIYPSCFAYPSPHSINNQTIKNIPKHGSWMWVLGFGTRSPASGAGQHNRETGNELILNCVAAGQGLGPATVAGDAVDSDTRTQLSCSTATCSARPARRGVTPMPPTTAMAIGASRDSNVATASMVTESEQPDRLGLARAAGN